MLPPRKLLLAVLVSATFIRPSVAAEEDWSLCRIPSFLFATADDIAVGETRIEAQTVASDDAESIHLVGDVNLLRRDQQIDADDVVIDKSNDMITASGNVFFADSDYQIKSPEIRIDNRNNQAQFDQAQFEMHQRHGRGEAYSIEKIDDNRSRFEDLFYTTTCDPGDDGWHMRAAELAIDRESGIGEATHATIYIQDVPILYLPYFQFPIDDRRKSGILAPSISYSDTNGSGVSIPVYWNQAPNYDMTITPTYYNESGLQLKTENRYLFSSHRGQLDLSYIDDSVYGESRWFQQWQHAADLPFDLQASMLFAKVSDDDYFFDFPTVAPQYSNTSHLERYLRLNHNEEFWRSELLVQDYQTLDNDTAITDRP